MNVFLTAEWRNLINFTYAVPPELLSEYLPDGVELDLVNGTAHVGFIAFDFLHTRVKGLSIPLHVNFPEVNLRFYVRYQGQMGVVFIREYVPKHAVAWIANLLYNEPYRAIPMRSRTEISGSVRQVSHTLKKSGKRHHITVETAAEAYLPEPSSPEHYFKEHSVGFGTTHSGNTLCYQVDHPVWRVYPVQHYQLDVDFGLLYGNQWAFLNRAIPVSVAVAEGSAVKVYDPVRLEQLAVLPPVNQKR